MSGYRGLHKAAVKGIVKCPGLCSPFVKQKIAEIKEKVCCFGQTE